jgi:hypothetical protein
LVTQDVFIRSRKSVDLALGGTIPILAVQWRYHRNDFALYAGPLARIGFLTPTDDDVVNWPGVGDTLTDAQKQSLRTSRKRVYHYWHSGVRVGQFRMSRGRSTAPREVWRLDLAAGRNGNLATVFGKRVEEWSAGPQTVTVTSYFTKADWRYVADGFMLIPRTPLFVGFSANVGRNPPALEEFDRRISAHPFSPRPEDKVKLLFQGPLVLPARDDVRLIFGARFDIAEMLYRFFPK